MNIETIKKQLKENKQYDFLKTNPYLGKNIVMLVMGGSYSYGTYREGISDIDIRGITGRRKEDILSSFDIQEIEDINTDTRIQTWDKAINKLKESNPNALEMIGQENENYLFLSDPAKYLLANKTIFFTAEAIRTLNEYASQQLYRLNNQTLNINQKNKEQNILDSIKRAEKDFNRKFKDFNKQEISLYLDDTDRPEFDKEIYLDAHLKHYPLRDYRDMFGDMNRIIKSYNKAGKRNTQAIVHGKIGKHASHLLRLKMTALELLETGIFKTKRKPNEISLLLDIINGKYLTESGYPNIDFYDIVNDYESKIKVQLEKNELPKMVEMEKVKQILITGNEMILDIYR